MFTRKILCACALVAATAASATQHLTFADPRPTGPDPAIERVDLRIGELRAGFRSATLTVTVKNRGNVRFRVRPREAYVYVWGSELHGSELRRDATPVLRIPLGELAIGEQIVLSDDVAWWPHPGAIVRRGYRATIVYSPDIGNDGYSTRDRNFTNNSRHESFATRD